MPGPARRSVALALPFALLVACGGDDTADDALTGPTTTEGVVTPTTLPPVLEPMALSVTAADSFDPAGLLPGLPGLFVPLDDPELVPVSEADWLDDDDVVLGLVSGDLAVGFPISQMAYHHVANLNLAGEPYVVTY